MSRADLLTEPLRQTRDEGLDRAEGRAHGPTHDIRGPKTHLLLTHLEIRGSCRFEVDLEHLGVALHEGAILVLEYFSSHA